jgi:hypothetical protein
MKILLSCSSVRYLQFAGLPSSIGRLTCSYSNINGATLCAGGPYNEHLLQACVEWACVASDLNETEIGLDVEERGRSDEAEGERVETVAHNGEDDRHAQLVHGLPEGGRKA